MERGKSKLAAILLGVFLGFCGAHSFYLCHIKKAIIQLSLTLLCPILFFLAVYLGLGIAHSTSNVGLAMFAQFLFALDIVVTIIAGLLWLTDIIIMIIGKVKDSNGLQLQ